MVIQADLVLGDGRTLHAYDAVADGADALGIEQFAVMGHSGGAAHALACAALLPERVLAAVCASGMAPYAEGLDWFAGMGPAGAAELRAAANGRAALEDHLARWTPSAELWLRPDDGHVSVLGAGEAALGWLWGQASRS